MRVGPELFADQVLEIACVIGGTGTGFVMDLWNALGEVAREELLTSIGSLEWRLSMLNGPSVMGPVWAGVHAVIDQGDYGTLHTLAGHLGMLPFTQPAKTVEILARIQQRLDILDSLPPEQNPSGRSAEDIMAAMFGAGPISRAAVEGRLSVPYGACAANAAEVLEEVLDALWNLGRQDPRPLNKALDHPCRVIVDQLCDVGRLPDPSYPSRIIATAGRWLDEPRRPDDTLTPLFVVAPFLAKEGTMTEMGQQSLLLRPYLVDSAWARPIRDSIRDLCLRFTNDEHLQVTAEIVRLLGGALREPVGLAGAEVTDEHRTVWAEDDLATIEALSTIADRTHKAVVRRAVRRAIEWSAVYATSLELRHAALSLVTRLDQLEDGDLSDFLFGGESVAGPASQRGETIPSLEDVREAASAAASKDRNEDDEAFNSRWGDHNVRVQAVRTRLAESLWPQGASPRTGVRLLDGELRDALLMSEDLPRRQLADLFSHVAEHLPDRLAGLVEEIIELPDGPVDMGLTPLLEGLRSQNPALLERLLTETPTLREGMRGAVARAARIHAWAVLGAPYAEAVMSGTKDSSDGVRQEFLAALPFMSDPTAVAESLIEQGAKEGTISSILGTAAWHHGQHWGRNLTAEQASAVLDLLSRLTAGTWETDQLIADIASTHPRLVLDRLSDDKAFHQFLRPPMYGMLQQALAESPQTTADWILAACRGTNPARVWVVLDKVVGQRLPTPVKDALLAALDDLDEEQLSHLFSILDRLDTWAAHHIDLARGLIRRSRQIGPEALSHALEQVRRRLIPNFWTYHGPESPELRAAHAAVTAAVESETDADLRELELAAERGLNDRMAQVRQGYEEEND